MQVPEMPMCKGPLAISEIALISLRPYFTVILNSNFVILKTWKWFFGSLFCEEKATVFCTFKSFLLKNRSLSDAGWFCAVSQQVWVQLLWIKIKILLLKIWGFVLWEMKDIRRAYKLFLCMPVIHFLLLTNLWKA